MFNFFKKKSQKEILNEKYKKLRYEAFRLSTSDRIKSDLVYAEAQEVLNQIIALEEKEEK